jgi:hypothetical protein
MTYQPQLAIFGVPLQRHTKFVELAFKITSAVDSATARIYADRFRDPVVARAGRDTYRTFLLREIPAGARHPETRRATVPIRVLFRVGDTAIHRSLVAPKPPTPTTTRCKPSTPATSSSMSDPTWCGRSRSGSPTRPAAEQTAAHRAFGAVGVG